jgi:hypothetical protein
MMRRIIATSLRFRFIVVAIAAGMMVFGAAQVRAMPVDVFPEFAPPKVEIQTICIGLSAEEVSRRSARSRSSSSRRSSSCSSPGPTSSRHASSSLSGSPRSPRLCRRGPRHP